MRVEEIVAKVRPWQCLMDIDMELPALIEATQGARAILEIGTFSGATAAALALAHPEAVITTIDLPDTSTSRNNAQDSHRCGEAIRQLGLDQSGVRTGGPINQVRMDSAELRRYVAAGKEFDAIFVDGDHSSPAVFRDLCNSAKLLSPGGVIIVHDYTAPGDASRPPWTIDVCDAVEMFLRLYDGFTLTRMPVWLAAIRRVLS